MTINEIITIIYVLVITTYILFLFTLLCRFQNAKGGEGRGQGEKKARKKQQTRQRNEAAIIIEDFFVHPTY